MKLLQKGIYHIKIKIYQKKEIIFLKKIKMYMLIKIILKIKLLIILIIINQ